MLRCTGCGSTQTIEQIRARNPKALSCCPERDMQPESAVAEAARKIGEAALADAVNWDDRTSPDDYPDHLLITGDELEKLFQRHIEEYFDENNLTVTAS